MPFKPPPTDRPLAIVFNGESNSGGPGRNEKCDPAELAPRPAVQIMNLTSGRFVFEDLRIGVNNLRDHTGLEENYDQCHGWENGLAHAAESRALAGRRQVYLIKTGHGGSMIAQWAEGSEYWKKFVQRTDAARGQLHGEPRWVVWLTLGINDAIAKTPMDRWKSDVAAYLKRVMKQLPGAIIVMTQFQSMGYPETNRAIAEIAADEPAVRVVDSTGATLIDTNHWDHEGLKTMAQRLVAATNEALLSEDRQ